MENKEFFLRPILDRVIIREIPLSEVLEQRGNLAIPVDDARFKGFSDRGVIEAVGDGVPMGGVMMPISLKVGDTVVVSEFGRDQIFKNPADKYDPSLPKYFVVRVADVKGVVNA